MRSLVWFLALTLGAVSAFGRTLEDIKRSRELRICVAGSSADYYQVNGEDFARYLGVEPRTTKLSQWDQQFHNALGVTVQGERYEAAALTAGKCDLYPNDLHITDWRKSKMTLVPYFTTRNVVVARPEMRALLRGEADLAGRKASVQAGTAYEKWLQGFNASAAERAPVVIETAPTAQSMQAVAQRRADFTVIAAESAFHWVRNDLDNLDMLFPVGDATTVGWGIAFAATDLDQALQRYFDDSRKVGSNLDQSWRHKYGVSLMEYQLFSASFDDSGKWHRVWVAWGIPVGAGIAGVLLAMLFWATRLRIEIGRHRLTLKALQQSHDQLTREATRRQAVSDLLLALQQTSTLTAFGRTVMRELARQLPVGQALMVQVDEARTLRALAHYAGSGSTAEQTLSEWPTTASMIERCAATGEPVLIEEPGTDYLRIQSGLGHCTPAAIYLLPIKHAGCVTAIIELALTVPFEQEHRRLLMDMEPIVAVGIQRFLGEVTSGDHAGMPLRSQEAS
ncbi:MAG: transporter substrate-binding domain-containing protein [Hyphomicrobiales bacterium]|nr:MAG: transporter substrate-binding domain-containing protein [Hyphomicrobiales bacterium]